MSHSDAHPSPGHLITVGDFNPEVDREIEFDFIGRKIAGRYTILAHIGGGGMADVYRATDEQLGIDVAIKLLKPRLASDELRARMIQEARAAAQIHHPNLMRVFGTEMLDNTAFIVMELCEGPNLEQYLQEYRNQRMPYHVAIELLLPAFAALDAIHERGYVHRDIKTGNILVAHAPGRPPTAIVIDLGLVKLNRALRDAASPPTTEVGRLLCTPGYTSPEQAAGLPVDRRSDVYSMAVTLYRVLAGRLPFLDARGQPFALLAKHIYNEPTMLAEAAGTADIPVAVTAVVERALSKDPASRPQTMLEFAEALRAAAQIASPPSTPTPKISRLLLGVAFLVTLALLVQPTSTSPPHAMAISSHDPDAPPVPVPAATTTAATTTAATTTAATTTAATTTAATTTAAVEPVPTSAETTVVAPSPARTAHKPPPDPHLASRRALAGRTREVQACVDRGATDHEQLTVVVDMNTKGRILARVPGMPETPLARCIDAALRRTHLPAPREPVSFEHTFHLRPSSHHP